MDVCVCVCGDAAISVTCQKVIQEVERFGRGSVLVWGGISIDNQTDLIILPGNITADMYIRDIIMNHIVPVAYGIGNGFILMHDNARVHTAAITRGILMRLEIQVMDWLVNSPDLNPIENVWDVLDRWVRRRPAPPQALQQLADALMEEWERIQQCNLRMLLRSMHWRCQEVINACRGHIQY